MKDRKIILLFLKFFIICFFLSLASFAFLNYITILAPFQPAFHRLPLYYTYFSAMIMYWTFPTTCLLATFLTLSSLNRSQEYLAYLSLGYSFRSVALPILLAVSGLSFVMISFNQNVLPYMVKKRKYILYTEFKKLPHLYSLLKMNKVWYRHENTLLNMRIFEPEKKTAQGVKFYSFDKNWKFNSIIESQSATMEPPYWNLKNGTMIDFTDEKPQLKNFLEKKILLDEKMGQIKNIENLTFALKGRELRSFIKKNKNSGISMSSYEVDYYDRWAHTLSAILFSLFCFVFFRVGERQKHDTSNIMICTVLSISFWLLANVLKNLARFDNIPPLTALALPFLIAFFVLGFLFNHQSGGRFKQELLQFLKLFTRTRKNKPHQV